MRKIRIREIPEHYEKLTAPNLNSKLRPSIGMESSVGEYLFIEIERLYPYSKQARRHFDEEKLQTLASTIKEYGIQQPLSVIKCEEVGKYEVISGERRLRAAKLAGLTKVPCIILKIQETAEEIAIIENLQRADLHPIELAQAYNNLLENYNRGDQKKLADKLGLSKSQISESLKLNTLPKKIRDHLIDNNISSREILRKFLNCNNENEMILLIEKNKFGNRLNSKKKKLFSIYIQDNTIISEPLSSNITIEEKTKLRKKLEEILMGF